MEDLYRPHVLATGLPATEQLDGRQRVALERRRSIELACRYCRANLVEDLDGPHVLATGLPATGQLGGSAVRSSMTFPPHS